MTDSSSTVLDSHQEAQPRCEELRVAIALNGGVSLAVWMGGCAVELDRARRAGDNQDTPRVYDTLCECFSRRLVVDILTGSSAGGINAALLGTAMVKGRRLDPAFIRERWVELGDLGAILHDAAEESPTALMDGDKFHRQLLQTFKEVLGTDEDAAGSSVSAVRPSADPRFTLPSLDITMTDVRGVERRFRDDWGGEFVAREHRPRFKFRNAEHFTEDTLAAAARTSASFPVAFDAWKVEGNARVLAELPGPTHGVDGGLLDNAPIRAALDLIPTRSANSVVRRYFCYVNADPAVSTEMPLGDQPKLTQVGGYVFNLPRVAPLVDHLYAVRKAVERTERSKKVQDELLGTDLPKLEAVAEALLGSYRHRRTLESLQELSPDPRAANAMLKVLRDTGGALPWIPSEWPPRQDQQWEWGLRPAQRILHFLLDLLRPAAREANPEKRRVLLKTRIEIDEQLERLETARDEVTAQPPTAALLEEEEISDRVNAAIKAAFSRAPQTRAAVLAAADSMCACMENNPELFPPEQTRALFGPRLPSRCRRRHFLRRMLAMEVVRRAFASEADIESAEPLHFIQLTPDAPAPIFTPRPLQFHGPTSAKKKLTGIGLGHFAGFFRRSWRVNDYMWGRLDAAVRIVDLLLDAPAESIATELGGSARKRAGEMAEALLQSAGEELWHLEEVQTAQAGGGDACFDLREWLVTTIAEELEGAETAAKSDEAPTSAAAVLPVTRVLFQRAAQIEVLREELPELRKESRKDHLLGSGAEPLELGGKRPANGLRDEVTAVRRLYQNESSLPKKLIARAEEVSNLGLQTITRTAFVGLAAVRTAGVPLSKFLGFARPPLLAISGSVARNRFHRLTVAIGFWVAALFLANCLVTAENIEPAFSSLGTPATMTGLAALLGVAGLALVPGVRARQKVRTARNVFYFVILVLTGGGLAAILALWEGDLSTEQVLTTPGAELPETWMLWTALAALGIASFSRLPAPAWLPVAKTLDKARRNTTLMCLLLLVAFALLAYSSVPTLVDVLDEEGWKKASALTALVAAPVAAFLALAPGRGVGGMIRAWLLRRLA